jgi:hypothetical protein
MWLRHAIGIRLRATRDLRTLQIESDRALLGRCAERDYSEKCGNHPTDPSRLMPSSFCASTANSIGSCWSTSLAKPLTISATAAS